MDNPHSKFINDILGHSALLRKMFEKMESKALAKVSDNHLAALKEAKRIILEKDPKSLTNELLKDLADEMQKWAKAILEERSKKKK